MTELLKANRNNRTGLNLLAAFMACWQGFVSDNGTLLHPQRSLTNSSAKSFLDERTCVFIIQCSLLMQDL